MATLKVRELGDYIREQRQASSISLRQLARLANVSNPYLSQIERGMRKPSAEILQQIAKALRISAEALYVQAGILDEREGDTDVPGAILRDEWITERQKQVLLEIYDSFRKENDGLRQAEADAEPVAAATPAKPAKPAKKAAKPAKKAAKKAPAKPRKRTTSAVKDAVPEAAEAEPAAEASG
ncbi:MAG TPA: helix-turn-helix transcriptional regulator [Frankiaceae bacterium]|nr:helix-turn-helix transcriptional regulator [Frankiaceae bacterium]